MPFEPGGLGDMLGSMFLPNTYGPGAGPPSPQGAPNPMTPPLWRPQNNLDNPLNPQYQSPPPAAPPGGGILDKIKGLLPQGPPDPRIPPIEGNPWGPPVRSTQSPLGEMDRRAQMREANAMPEDPRIAAYRQQQVPPVAPKLPMTPPGGGIQGMLQNPMVQDILSDPRKMQAAMQTPAAQSMLQDPRAMAYLQQMLQGR